MLPAHRIARRKLHSLHPVHRLLIRRPSADIPVLAGRIRPNHQKVITGLQPGNGRPYLSAAPQHRLAQHASPRVHHTAQHQLAPPLRNPQHLMRGRVVMMKAVHPISSTAEATRSPRTRPPSARRPSVTARRKRRAMSTSTGSSSLFGIHPLRPNCICSGTTFTASAANARTPIPAPIATMNALNCRRSIPAKIPAAPGCDVPRHAPKFALTKSETIFALCIGLV